MAVILNNFWLYANMYLKWIFNIRHKLTRSLVYLIPNNDFCLKLRYENKGYKNPDARHHHYGMMFSRNWSVFLFKSQKILLVLGDVRISHLRWTPKALLDREDYMLFMRSTFYNTNDKGIRNPLSTLRPIQDGRHFPDDTFKWFFLNENV